MALLLVNPTFAEHPCVGEVATDNHFGVNILFDRDRLNSPGCVEGRTETYRQGIDALGCKTIRYPGGTLAEMLFDLEDPNGSMQNFTYGTVEQMFDPDGSGPLQPSTLGLWDAMSGAAAINVSMTFVMPTIRFAGTSEDANGNRYPAVDVEVVHSFVIDLLQHASKTGVTLQAIELGNEWWVDNSSVFGTNLTAVEYGRIASELAQIVRDAINDFVADNNPPSSWNELQVLVQTGPGGKAEWVLPTGGAPPEGYNGPKASSTELIYNEFDTAAEQRALDGLVTHRYLTGNSVDGWAYRPFEAWNELSAGNTNFKEMSLYVSEWNVSAKNHNAMGLLQAGALASLLSEMLRSGVDHADVWAVQQANETNLTLNTGYDPEEYSGLSIAGETFRLLRENVVGMQSLPIGAASKDLGVEVFSDSEHIVFFVSNLTDSARIDMLDISRVASNASFAFGTTINVVGPDCLDGDAVPKINTISSGELLFGAQLRIALDPYETICVEVSLGSSGCNINGSGAADRMNGSSFADIISGCLGDDAILGDAGNDTIYGGAGSDRLYGNNGNDLVSGEAGDDSLFGGCGRDTLIGGAGDDCLKGGDGNDMLFGKAGHDTIYGGGGADRVEGGAGDDSSAGGDGGDMLLGGGGNDWLEGQNGSDHLSGGAGNDTLLGGQGSDTLCGGGGEDWLNGGAGSDIFLFKAMSDSVVGRNRDSIAGFVSSRDCIDLSAIDVNSMTGGDQEFHFIGRKGFTGYAGELRYRALDDGLIVEADIDGNGRADMQIFVEDISHLFANDFIL